MPLLLQRVGLLIAFTNEVHCCGLHFNLQNNDFGLQGWEILPYKLYVWAYFGSMHVLEACNLGCGLKRLKPLQLPSGANVSFYLLFGSMHVQGFSLPIA